MKNARAMGVITSYLFMGVNTVVTFVLTPLMIRLFGVDLYGDHQFLCAILCVLELFDFGFQELTTRYVSVYDLEGKDKERENFLAIALLFACGVSVLILVLGGFLYWGLPRAFPVRFASAQMQLVLPAALFMAGGFACRIFLRFFLGVVYGKNRYAWGNAVQIFQVVLRLVLILLLLSRRPSILLISATETAAIAVAAVLLAILALHKLDVKIKFHHADPIIVRAIWKFGLAAVMTLCAAFLTDRVSQIILGFLVSGAFVTVYSVSHTIFSNFTLLGTNVSAVYLTKASTLMASDPTPRQMEDYWIAPGRLQLLICGTLFCGFLVAGNDFLTIWLGEPDPWVWITCIVMTASNVLTVLLGSGTNLVMAHMKKLHVVSWLAMAGAVVNVVFLYLFVKRMGYAGVLVAAVLSNFLARGVAIPAYIRRLLNINVVRVYREMFRGIFPALGLAAAAACFLGKNLPVGVLGFLGRGALFLILEIVALWKFGITKEERAAASSLLRKLTSKFRKS